MRSRMDMRKYYTVNAKLSTSERRRWKNFMKQDLLLIGSGLDAH